VLNSGKSIQISPSIISGLNADFDGDTVSFHVPVGEKAVKEAYEKLLPSRHLRNVATFKTHYHPSQEYALGLYLATKKGLRKGRDAGRFRNREDVIRAWRRGEIGLHDEVTVE
jgi:DNA-directed RNA polymerase beta' subunit